MKYGTSELTQALARPEGDQLRTMMIAEVLRLYRKVGSVSGVARLHKISVRTLWRWVNEVPELRREMRGDQRERTK